MEIQPANIDQIRQARDGRMLLISSDAGGVADELRRIDRHLKVRFAENGRPPFWAVYYESDDGRETYLVTTAQAHQTMGGIWTGLDHRIVERVRKADGHSRGGEDYAKALEAHNKRVREGKRQEFRDQVSQTGEMAVHALRKDLGIKSRIFVK